MSFARIFIDRPVLAIVLSIVIIIAGVVAIPNLPVTQYPDIAPPTVTVSANYPGASSQTVASSVAAPIEQQVNGVENMLYMSSQSTNDGSYRLTVTFKLGTNLDTAQVQVQNRVATALAQLPEEVQRIGVTTRKASPDLTLAVQLFSPDDSLDRLYISNYALLQVRDQLTRLPGVGDVFIFGARDYAMRIWLDPAQVAARNLTPADIFLAIREQNVQVAAGILGAEPVPQGITGFTVSVTARGRLVEPEEFKRIIIKTGAQGEITTLGDVARIELGAADYSINAYMNGRPSVGMGIFQLPGTNAITTSDAIRAEMAKLKQSFPPGLEYDIPYDTTLFVRESIRDVIKTLVEAVILVVLVVIVFLQRWRAAIIPLLAIPVSLIGTFAVMYLMGFSINNLSLFGIVLAIGIVVDDAIVVVENVERWIEAGLTPREAAYKSMDEVTTAVIAIAFGLSAVFIPTAFISGISGQFYRQFALTIAVATLLSAFNSLTLSPALAALLLRPHHGKQDFLQRFIDFVFGWPLWLFDKSLSIVTSAYAATLRRVVRLSIIVLLVYGGLIVLTYFGFKTVPTSFIPPQDAGYFIVNVQLPDAASLDRTDEVMRRLGKIANETPGIKYTFNIVGYSFLTGTPQSNTGAIIIVLDSFADREKDPVGLSGPSIIATMQRKYAGVQEGIVGVFPPPPVRGLSTAGGVKLQVQDRTGRLTPAELQAATDQLAFASMRSGQIAFAFSTFRSNVPQYYVDIDRIKAKNQNIAVTDIFDALQTYLGSRYVNDFNYLGRTYRVNIQADAPKRITPADLLQLKTRNRNGEMVPLSSVVSVNDIAGPARIQRYNLYQSAEINAIPVPGTSSGTAIATLERLAAENLPPGVSFEWTELTLQEILAGNTAIFVFPLCVLFVFLTHAAEYESFPLSLAIILIVPMCLFSAIAALFMLNMDNNIFTQIGFVVLVGLAAKNAVLIVEFAKQREEAGDNFFEAPIAAARTRLRPILMTSLAFILGVLPLLRAHGAGAEMRQAIGTAVFYGMIGVTIFGIFFTPVFYYVIRWTTSKIFGNKPAHHRHLPPPNTHGPESP